MTAALVGLPAKAAAPTDPPEAQRAVTSPKRTEARGNNLSGDRSAAAPTLGTGALAAAVWAMTWFASRRSRRVVAHAIGGPVFLVVLFVFYENVARLLPANI